MKNGRYEEGEEICWYLNGKLHREDGPAFEVDDGTKSWFLNGVLHCEDGPAIEEPDGTKHWYMNGEEFTEEEFGRWLAKKKLNEDLQSNLTPKIIEKENNAKI